MEVFMAEERISRDSSRYAYLLMGRAREYMLKAREQELAPHQITHRQAYVADILYNLGRKATLTELARNVDRGVNTLSYLMTRMERDGLVKGVREKPKSTLLKFELTEKGIAAYKKSEERASIHEIMSVLSEEERQQLILMMQKLISATEKYRTKENHDLASQ
jgi:DNA-binding MarR family transcriptional regulator